MARPRANREAKPAPGLTWSGSGLCRPGGRAQPGQIGPKSSWTRDHFTSLTSSHSEGRKGLLLLLLLFLPRVSTMSLGQISPPSSLLPLARRVCPHACLPVSPPASMQRKINSCLLHHHHQSVEGKGTGQARQAKPAKDKVLFSFFLSFSFSVSLPPGLGRVSPITEQEKGKQVPARQN